MKKQQHRDAGSYLPLLPNDFEILLSLVETEKHGYRIIRDIERRTHGTVRLGTSTLYAAIGRMLASGILEDAGKKEKDVSGGPRRHYYRLSKLGRDVIRLEALRLQEVAAAARKQILEPEAGS